jgi:hypothetical protein
MDPNPNTILFYSEGNEGKWAGWGMWHTMEGTNKAFRVLVAIAERGRPPGRLRHSWKDNIKNGSYRNKVGWCELDSSILG